LFVGLTAAACGFRAAAEEERSGPVENLQETS
jgi:hypothetical protein